jgi:glycosyltransferase involved in cell wall biosynthesis
VRSPSVTTVIATLNSEKYLAECLGSLRSQDYDGELEIVIADAGSTDRTLAIARELGVERVLPNPLKTGEAGKAVGIHAAEGELILSVDSDNVVVGRDWLRRMVEPLADPDVISSQALRWEYRRSDHFITRWAALSGINDPLALYVGNYDRYSHITGRWTDFPHEEEERDGWLCVRLDPNWVPAMGANGYLVRRKAFEVVPVGDYFFDIDFVYELARRGHSTIALVDVPIRHYFCDGVATFRRKTRRRVDDYVYFATTPTGRSYPWTSRRGPIAKFVASTLLVAPVVTDVIRGVRRRRDRAWLFHLPACWITLGVYGAGYVRGMLRPRMLDRTGWRQ